MPDERETRHRLSEGEIVTSRVLDAPRERVFRAFTEPDVLASWWGSRGFTNTFEEFDPRPGGAWRLVMRAPDGTEFRMVKEFVELVAPERIAMRHLDPVHGFEMLITLTDAGEGGTEVGWRMRFESAAELARVRGPLAEANEQNLDRLAARLAEVEPKHGAASAMPDE